MRCTARTSASIQARALTFRLAWPAAPYHGRVDVNAFSRELETRLKALPGVEEAGAISHLPFDNISNWAGRYLTESTAANEMATRFADVRAVSPGMLRSLGVTLVEGRWFTEADDERQSLVSIVDERLAALAWPGRSAIGQRLRVGMYADRTVVAGWTTVVGVVRHMRHRRPDAEAQEQIYVPFRQSLPPTMAYVVRTAADPARLSSEVRRVVASLDGLLPPYDIQPLAAYVARATSARRFTALLFSLFALLTLVLACVGLAGLISHSVAVRQREFGIRLALGATPAGVRSKVLTEALGVAAAGLGAGLVASILAANAMRALLFGVGPVDAVSYAGAIAVLGLAGAAACWWPARRASRVNPMDALRSE